MTEDEFEKLDYSKIVIKICCSGADTMPLDSIEEFQGSLKKRSKKDIEKIIRSIVEYGFSFPFFIWNGAGHNYCLDGHGRILALAEMRKKGTNLPLFPVAYIDAENEQQAKQKLLRLNSQYGLMSLDSVVEFADGMELNGDELELGFSFDNKKNVESNEVDYKAKMQIVIDCEDEDDMHNLYDEFISRGLKCKLSTL